MPCSIVLAAIQEPRVGMGAPPHQGTRPGKDIFEAPFEFRIDRSPNRHLGFGIGEHFCLGANLARRSQRALFRELAQRLGWAELAGEPEQIHSAFVVGLKKLPMRYRIKPAA